MLIPVCCILRQTLADNELQLDRHGGAQAGERLGFLVDDLVQQRLVVRAFERSGAGDHFIQHAAERPQIAAVVDLAALRLLGRHVGHGAHRSLGFGQPRRFGQPRQAEVHDGDLAVLGDQNVGGLDVAVNDAFLVGGLQALRDLPADFERILDGSPARVV